MVINRNGETDGTEKDFLIYEEGDALEEDEAALLEGHIIEQPNDLVTRLLLLRYYSNAEDFNDIEDWVRHYRWMIANRPRDWITGNTARRFRLTKVQVQGIRTDWSEQLRAAPNDLNVLLRAAEYFQKADPALGEELAKRGCSLEPNNPVWFRILMDIYMDSEHHSLRADGSNLFSVKSAFEEGDKAIARENHPGERRGLLEDLCAFSLRHNELEGTEKYAAMLLELARDRELDFITAKALSYQGRVAIRRGNLNSASEHLKRAAGEASISVMNFALEVLKAGDRDAVLNFLATCLVVLDSQIEKEQTRGYVSDSDTRKKLIVERWISEIENGQVPSPLGE